MQFLNYVEQSYQTIDFKNYLVLQQKQEITPIVYCCKMIEINQISGLLPMYRKQINDQTSFYYNIAGKTRLVNYLQRGTCSETQGRAILLHLAEGLKNLSNYFLQQQFCILDLEYIFVNDALDVFFPVLPIEELLSEDISVQFFFQKLVSQYFVTEESNPFYDNLLKYLVRNEFQLDEFIKYVQPQQAEPVILELKPLQIEKNSNQVEEVKKEKLERNLFPKIEQKKISEETPVVLPIDNGIKIPGAQPINEKSKKEKKSIFGGGEKTAKKVKEKKEKKEFHLFGGNKSEKLKDELTVKPHLQEIPAEKDSSKIELSQAAPSYDDVTVILGGEQLGETSVYFMHQGQRIPIYKTPFVLGKVNADYHLEKSFISRVHATVIEKDGKYYIQDENSKNHTYLNGVQLAPYTTYLLENGSRIKLGIEELVFYLG